jgi:hypothetical protein
VDKGVRALAIDQEDSMVDHSRCEKRPSPLGRKAYADRRERATKDTDKRLAEIVGYNYYLTKPCDPNVLLTLVRKAKR